MANGLRRWIPTVALLTLSAMNCPSRASEYAFEAVYTGEVWHNATGGLNTGTRYLDNLDIALGIDLPENWGIGSGSVYAHVLYNNATTFSDELVGDLQVVSNIEATKATRLFEFWYEVGTGPWSVRTGLYDLNSEFDAHDTGALFINSSHGIGAEISQTGQNGPSIFPVSGLALRGAYTGDRYAARLAIIDGVPGNPGDPASNEIDLGGDDGVLTIAELDVNVDEHWRIWSGAWRYSADFDRLRGSGVDNDNRGLYIGAEWDGEVDGRPIGWFVRYGVANDDINPVKAYLGAGVAIGAPFKSRPHDHLGASFAQAFAGSPYRQLLVDDGLVATRSERILEITYRAVVGDWLALQPNMQFIAHPSATRTIDNALVLGLRFELAWGNGG